MNRLAVPTGSLMALKHQQVSASKDLYQKLKHPHRKIINLALLLLNILKGFKISKIPILTIYLKLLL